MNAIVNLNHFCEIHGPQTIFSTQTIREKSFLSHHSSNNNITNTCCACGSIGSKVIFLTEDKDSSTMFVSSEKSIFGKEHQSSLKVTCLRSLSCEVRIAQEIIIKVTWNIIIDNSKQSRRSGVLWRWQLASKLFVLHVQSKRFAC